MISFDSGHFMRSWKHGYHDMDPAWSAAEQATVNASIAAIQLALPRLIQIVAQQMTKAHTVLPFVLPDKPFLYRWHNWTTRIGKTMKMFIDMQIDLGTGGKKIGLRKACDLRIADQISALCEFQGAKPRWVVSMNGNPKDTACYFFAKANATKATASLFHEMTHLYGTEDTGVMAIENAHRLEALMGPRSATILNRLLAKQREFTLLGDVDRLPRGAVMSMSRLTAIFGAGNCWDKKGFAANFTGDPVNGNVTRTSDSTIGSISIVWDANNQPLYFYNFR